MTSSKKYFKPSKAARETREKTRKKVAFSPVPFLYHLFSLFFL